MRNCFKYGIYLLCVLVFGCLNSEGSEVIQDFLDGKTKRPEVAILVDVSAGNLENIKEFWRAQSIKYKGRITFGVIGGSGYETPSSLENLQDLIGNIEELEPNPKPRPSSSELFRYLLKTMSLTPTESDIILFTGRATEEEPLQKACIDKARGKQCRVCVLWTDVSLDGSQPLRSLAEASGSSLEPISYALKKVTSDNNQENSSIEAAIQPRTLSKILEPSNEEEHFRRIDEIVIEDKDKTLQKLERVRFPDKQPEISSDGNEMSNTQNFNRSMGRQQSRIAQFIPVTVEVASASSLDCMPGGRHSVQYDVKNNLHVPLHLTFMARQPQNIRIINVQPDRQFLQPMETIKVEVAFESQPNMPDGGEGSLIFAAVTEFGGITPRNTLIHFTTQPIHDTWDPTVSYTYRGDCRGHDKPDTCDTGEWKFDATFQDQTSGLKKVLSEPYGLTFTSPFIAGTKAPVSVSYTASCCKPKIEIWAEDGQGNFVRRSLDVYNQGLLAGEIAAVVLGVLLLICIIIGIIVAIIIVRRRKQNTLVIPRYQGTN